MIFYVAVDTCSKCADVFLHQILFVAIEDNVHSALEVCRVGAYFYTQQHLLSFEA